MARMFASPSKRDVDLSHPSPYIPVRTSFWLWHRAVFAFFAAKRKQSSINSHSGFKMPRVCGAFSMRKSTEKEHKKDDRIAFFCYNIN